MADKKSFREKRTEARDEVVAFWGTTKGLITAGVIVVGVVAIFFWDTISAIIGAVTGAGQ